MIESIFIVTTAGSTYFGMAILAFLVACRMDPHRDGDTYKLFAALWPVSLPALLFLKAWETIKEALAAILGVWSSIFDKILEEHQEREADRIRERADALLERFRDEKQTEPATLYRWHIGSYADKANAKKAADLAKTRIVNTEMAVNYLGAAVRKGCMTPNEARAMLETLQELDIVHIEEAEK